MQNLEVMVVLFIIVILGYVACKLGYMGDKFDKKLSSIVVDITCPLLVLSSVMGDELPDRTLILVQENYLSCSGIHSSRLESQTRKG